MSMIALLLFPAGMVAAAASDLLTMKIPNLLVLLLTAAFLIVAVIAQLPLDQLGMHLLCALAVLAGGFTFFAFGWIGGGDAKLAAATALWLGFGVAVPYLVYAALFGGALTLAILGLRNMPLMPVFARYSWLERLREPKTGVPYGIALALAGLMTYTSSPIFERLAS